MRAAITLSDLTFAISTSVEQLGFGRGKPKAGTESDVLDSSQNNTTVLGTSNPMRLNQVQQRQLFRSCAGNDACQLMQLIANSQLLADAVDIPAGIIYLGLSMLIIAVIVVPQRSSIELFSVLSTAH